MKKYVSCLLCVAACWIFCMLSVSAESIQMNKESVTVVSGESYQLNVLVNGVVKAAAWGSSDTSVATVSSSGLVTGKAAGSAVISGADQVGGVVGRVSESTIEKCNNYAPIKATGRCVGGVTSDVYPSGTLTSCNNYGEVEGHMWLTGGISGGCTRGKINDCHNYAKVTGGKGLVGDAGGFSGSNNSTI